MKYQNLEEMLQELDEGILVSGMIPSALMDFVDESNIDQTLAAIPDQYRTSVLEWAHSAVFSPEHELINLIGQSNLTDIRPEDKQHPRERVFHDALRSWFLRHPWPEPK